MVTNLEYSTVGLTKSGELVAFDERTMRAVAAMCAREAMESDQSAEHIVQEGCDMQAYTAAMFARHRADVLREVAELLRDGSLVCYGDDEDNRQSLEELLPKGV